MTDDLDPLRFLSDEQLFATQLSLALACGRSRSALKDKHRSDLCFLFTLLLLESHRRDRPSPTPPYRA